jgi:hypothetical protein
VRKNAFLQLGVKTKFETLQTVGKLYSQTEKLKKKMLEAITQEPL